MQQSNTMKQAGEKLLDLNSDEAAREIAMARQYSQMAYRDELHAREQKGIQQGIEQGVRQGALKNALETARKLLSMGLSVSQVVEGTGLTVIEVEQLQSEKTN